MGGICCKITWMSNRYILFHKPYGVLSTFTDSEGRSTLKNYIPIPGIYSAGRLDYDSEGLLILTDDGELIHRLTDPDSHLAKTYLVQVEGEISEEVLHQLQMGVEYQGIKNPALQGDSNSGTYPAGAQQTGYAARCHPLVENGIKRREKKGKSGT